MSVWKYIGLHVGVPALDNLPWRSSPYKHMIIWAWYSGLLARSVYPDLSMYHYATGAFSISSQMKSHCELTVINNYFRDELSLDRRW